MVLQNNNSPILAHWMRFKGAKLIASLWPRQWSLKASFQAQESTNLKSGSLVHPRWLQVWCLLLEMNSLQRAMKMTVNGLRHAGWIACLSSQNRPLTRKITTYRLNFKSLNRLNLPVKGPNACWTRSRLWHSRTISLFSRTRCSCSKTSCISAVRGLKINNAPRWFLVRATLGYQRRNVV